MPKLKSDGGAMKQVKQSFSPTTTANAPDGEEGSIYFDSDKNVLMSHDGTTYSKISFSDCIPFLVTIITEN